MLSENELKEELQVLAEKNFKPDDVNPVEQLLPAMLNHIGSIDSELRDNLIYVTFIRWVMTHKLIADEKLKEIFNTLLDEKHLFHQFGETGTDSIFTRSFSALWLPPILIAHREKAFLSREAILESHTKLLRFLLEEKDRRGFVAGKGWAHAIAHAADALDDLAQCAEVGEKELREMLPVICATMCMPDFVYAHGEDERMVTPVLAIIRRNLLTDDVFEQWLAEFATTIDNTKIMPDGVILRANIQNFLQSLYFRLKWTEENGTLLPIIEKTLHAINIFTR